MYIDRVVCFVDILGWGAEVDSILDAAGAVDNSQLEKLHRALDLVESIVNESKPGTFTSGFDVTQFSDSLIISSPLVDGSVFYLLNRLQLLQTEFIEEGLLLRGGVVVGKCVHSDRRVFGEAMNKAYLLESKKACYPRIVVDQTVIESVKNGIGVANEPAEELIHIHNILSVDEDELLMIDYFQKTAENFDPIESFHDVYLPGLERIVAKGLIHPDSSVKKKYQWLDRKTKRIS